MNALTDTHCHLYFDAYDEDRDDVLAQAWGAGLERILVPGIDLASSQAALALAESHPEVFAAVGVHPNDAVGWDAGILEEMEALAAHPKAVAIGEIGLDYYWDRTPRALQHEVFQAQLTLAERVNLPVVMHTRNKDKQDSQCIEDTLKILTAFQNRISGVLHSFSGNIVALQRALDLGFYIGVTGPVTFKNAHELRRVVASIPLDRLLIETDGPFLTPHPHRGKRNQPGYVALVAEKIAEIFNLSISEIAEITTTNARNLFGWS